MKAIKKSVKRDKIYESLKSVYTHPTAEWIYMQLKSEMPDLSLATVYRNLGLLVEMGLAQIIDDGSGITRFDANFKPHYHITCTKCKKVSDLFAPFDDNLALQLTKGSGFEATGYALMVFGLCPDCQNK